MGYTKRQFVVGAFDELALASYIFDIAPEELEACLRRLDSMMAEWNAKGIRVGYPIPGSPQDSDLDDPTSVPDSANEAIMLNLAIKLAPSQGKTLSPDTKASAKAAYNTLLSRACFPPEMQFSDTLPLGAGNKPLRIGSTFMPRPVETIDAGTDNSISLD